MKLNNTKTKYKYWIKSHLVGLARNRYKIDRIFSSEWVTPSNLSTINIYFDNAGGLRAQFLCGDTNRHSNFMERNIFTNVLCLIEWIWCNNISDTPHHTTSQRRASSTQDRTTFPRFSVYKLYRTYIYNLSQKGIESMSLLVLLILNWTARNPLDTHNVCGVDVSSGVEWDKLCIMISGAGTCVAIGMRNGCSW